MPARQARFGATRLPSVRAEQAAAMRRTQQSPREPKRPQRSLEHGRRHGVSEPKPGAQRGEIDRDANRGQGGEPGFSGKTRQMLHERNERPIGQRQRRKAQSAPDAKSVAATLASKRSSGAVQPRRRASAKTPTTLIQRPAAVASARPGAPSGR